MGVMGLPSHLRDRERDRYVVLVDGKGVPRGLWGPYTESAADSCGRILEDNRPGMRAHTLTVRGRNVPLRAATTKEV